MGEIDRIHPILRPIFGPRSADAVNRDGRHRARHEDRDRVELENAPPEAEGPEEEEPPSSPESRLDLSI